MLNFPAAPVDGEEYTDGSTTYTWADPVWKKVEVSSSQWVARGGDLMTGELGLPIVTPLLPETATNKKYVDEAIAATALYQGVWQVAANTPDLTPGVINALHSYSWIAVTADPAVPEVVPPGITGIEGTSLTEGDTVLWNGLLGVYEVIHAVALSGNFVSKTGDVMTGALHIQNAPGSGMMSLLTGDTTNNARIDWINPDGTRKAYIGYRDPLSLEINLDSADRLTLYGGRLHLSHGGIHMDANTAVTDPADLSKGLCLYGYGGTGEFGFSITASTINYMAPTGAKHDLYVGAANVLSVQGTTSFLNTNLTMTGDLIIGGDVVKITNITAGSGYTIGDAYHGMVFNGSNTMQFREYHGNFEFRQKTASVDNLLFKIGPTTGELRGQFTCRRESGFIWNTKALVVCHSAPDGTVAPTGGEAGIALYNHNGSDGGLRKHVFTLEKVADRFVARNGDDAAGGCIKFVASGFDTVSDLKWKHDVRPMEKGEASAAFAALNPIRFRWNAGEDQRLHWGLSANDLEQGAPDAVTTGTFGEKSYGIEQVLAIAIAKIQALEVEIAELRAGGYRGV